MKALPLLRMRVRGNEPRVYKIRYLSWANLVSILNMREAGSFEIHVSIFKPYGQLLLHPGLEISREEDQEDTKGGLDHHKDSEGQKSALV